MFSVWGGGGVGIEKFNIHGWGCRLLGAGVWLGVGVLWCGRLDVGARGDSILNSANSHADQVGHRAYCRRLNITTKILILQSQPQNAATSKPHSTVANLALFAGWKIRSLSQKPEAQGQKKNVKERHQTQILKALEPLNLKGLFHGHPWTPPESERPSGPRPLHYMLDRGEWRRPPSPRTWDLGFSEFKAVCVFGFQGFFYLNLGFKVQRSELIFMLFCAAELP